MIKTVGKWVAFQPLMEESASGIKSESLDKGIICSKPSAFVKENGLRLKDKIHFDINKVAYKSSDYWIIDVDYIYGVIE